MKQCGSFLGRSCGELLDLGMVCCLPIVVCVLSCGMIILSRVCLIFTVVMLSIHNFLNGFCREH